MSPPDIHERDQSMVEQASADTRRSAMIDIRAISKAYGNYAALDGIDMEIRQGEFFSLVGPSGCGKTTLLKIIGGFEQTTAGRLLIAGEDMSGIPAYRRPTNMVFQSYALFPHMNIRRNVSYGVRKSGLPAAEKAQIVDEALALVKMSDFADRLPGQLSGGQRQRIALARAIVCKPKVLLLDEPLGALDKRLREEMQFELKSLQRRLGITFVCVTHDQEEAMSMSDRIAVMSAGRLLQIDTPDNLYERPLSRDVADFVGNMNFFDVQARERRDN
ncbi:MAG TPA: ABC transporter ATP-binding protein, partial [Rhizobium sp.]